MMLVSRLAFFTYLSTTATTLTIPAAVSILPALHGNSTTLTINNETSASLLNTYPPVPFTEWISIEINAYIWVHGIWPAYGDAAHTESILNSLILIQEKFPIGGTARIERAHESNGLVTFDFQIVDDVLTANHVFGVLLAVRRLMVRYGTASISGKDFQLGLYKAAFQVHVSGG